MVTLARLEGRPQGQQLKGGNDAKPKAILSV